MPIIFLKYFLKKLLGQIFLFFETQNDSYFFPFFSEFANKKVLSHQFRIRYCLKVMQILISQSINLKNFKFIFSKK